eukprot:5891219-Amphidinium_carterae.1
MSFWLEGEAETLQRRAPHLPGWGVSLQGTQQTRALAEAAEASADTDVETILNGFKVVGIIDHTQFKEHS